MGGWANWEQIQKCNDWGVRGKNDETAELWDLDAERWAKQALLQADFNQKQVEALDLRESDVVIEIGCGVGALTLDIARRVKQVIAVDYGENVLRILKERAREAGIQNIKTVQGNWFTMEPGRDLPVCDVAVERWSPAECDLLKMSLLATRQCYSLTSTSPLNADGSTRKWNGPWLKSDQQPRCQEPRPDSRLYGYNVHFNLLYDTGAHPTIQYVEDTHDMGPGFGKHTIAILGWNPSELYGLKETAHARLV